MWLDWWVLPVAVEIAALAAPRSLCDEIFARARVCSLGDQAAVRSLLCACDLARLAFEIGAVSNSFRSFAAIDWPTGGTGLVEEECGLAASSQSKWRTLNWDRCGRT